MVFDNIKNAQIYYGMHKDFEKAFDNAAKLTAYLVKTYNLSVDDIKQHGDFISKNCPETIRNEGRSDEFVQLAQDYLKQIK